MGGDIAYTVTNSAYTQARAKLNYTAFVEMKDKSVEMFYEDGEYNRYKNFRLLAIDGSVVILPNSDRSHKGSEFKPEEYHDMSRTINLAKVFNLYFLFL